MPLARLVQTAEEVCDLADSINDDPSLRGINTVRQNLGDDQQSVAVLEVPEERSAVFVWITILIDELAGVIHHPDGQQQPARLATGEFVFPARIVSEIGNGSSDAGAQKLYAIMDKIQNDRKRTIKNVAADTDADRHFNSMMA
jgi:hypothetical protein